MTDPTIIRAIADAVERAGGDMEDVRDLLEVWERLRGDLRDANASFNAGDESGAEKRWKELEDEFARPLDEIVRDHLHPERER
ncbi:MAG: hypothetical protein ACLQMH_13545 [Solirubrobacteraceae bacterium]